MPKPETTVDMLREILADTLSSIPRHEWAVRVALAKLEKANAELALARVMAQCPGKPPRGNPPNMGSGGRK